VHCKSQLYFYDSKTTLFSYRLFGSEGNGYKRTTRQRNAWNATFMLIVSKSLRQGDHSDSGLYKFGLEVIVATSLFVNLAGVGMYCIIDYLIINLFTVCLRRSGSSIPRLELSYRIEDPPP